MNTDRKPDSIRNTGPIDFAIVTALEVERNAVLNQLNDYDRVIEDTELLPYYIGHVGIAGSKSHYSVVVISLLEMGNDEAAVATSQLIARWDPASIIMLGIAGGVKEEVSLGDVVVANFSHYYEPGKLTESGRQARSQQFHTDRLLLARAHAYDAGEWMSNVHVIRPGGEKQRSLLPKVKFGPIASGEQVIASQEEIDKLVAECPKLCAIAMEGAGVARAARNLVNARRFIEVRGISDFADIKKNDKWRAYAAETAAAFTIGFLRGGHLPPPVDIPRASSTTEARPVLVIRAQSLRAIGTTEILTAFEDDPTLREREIDTVLLDFTDLTHRDELTDPAAAVRRLVDQDGALLSAMVRRSEADLVFHGLAHIPLAVLAGHMVTDRQHVRLFDFHKDTWSWPAKGFNYPELEVHGLPAKRVRREGDAIIRFSVSYVADAVKAKIVVPRSSVEIDVTVPVPERGIIRSEDQVLQYGQEFRRVIDNLARHLVDGQRIHLFYAGPMALAFHIGQQISANIHPPVIVWNNRQSYNWGIDLSRLEDESCIIYCPQWQPRQ